MQMCACSVSLSITSTSERALALPRPIRGGSGAMSDVRREPNALRTQRTTSPWSTPPATETTIFSGEYRRR